MTWRTLKDHAILPTPANFELLYTHFSGANRALSERLISYFGQGRIFSSDETDALYDEFIRQDADLEPLDKRTNQIAQVAQGILQQVSDNQNALKGYGDVLKHSVARMAAPTSVESLLTIVAALRDETAQAALRNSALEHELSASTDRINKLQQNLIQTRQEASTDTLTAIANRKAFDAELRRCLRQAKASPTTTFSIIMLDVDHFKRFNDTHGHRMGDHVLRLVGRLLSDNVKGRDTAARYGGEEFAIILADADLNAAMTVAEQIRGRLSTQRVIRRGTGETIGQITISAGVAQHRLGESSASLIERADAALYEAKRSGRNKVCRAGDETLAS
ncbi:GGDEF domain-containing protein [Methylobacterium sp. 37f]|nr:GGDEF domain-containing protein [Methylobacterium sp. 37f]MCK2055317.1 GGDEF domain-containing protein [Methylobacterium sp. 37f]